VKRAEQSSGLADIGFIGVDADARGPSDAAEDRFRIVDSLQALE
jgi:hypothetical protein